ncbi:MAG: hypothetical protein Q4G66_13205 [bacterium]|nr:hypothetical protein [bacterium]
MQPDGSLSFAKFGPWENREAQIDSRGIKEIEFFFELEAMLGTNCRHCWMSLWNIASTGKQAAVY